MAESESTGTKKKMSLSKKSLVGFGVFILLFLFISSTSFSQEKIDLKKYKSMTYSELINDNDLWFTGKRFLKYDKDWNCSVDVKTGIHWGDCYDDVHLTDGNVGTIKITRKKLIENKDGTYTLPGKGEIAYSSNDPRNPRNRNMDKANTFHQNQPPTDTPDPLTEFKKEFPGIGILSKGDYWQDAENPDNKFVYRNHHWRRAVYGKSCSCWN